MCFFYVEKGRKSFLGQVHQSFLLLLIEKEYFNKKNEENKKTEDHRVVEW